MELPSPEPHSLAAAERSDVLCAEIATLGAGAELLREGDLRVIAFRAHEAPALMREMGRCRERTFRAIGEGSGRPRDLDRFDAHYLQLALWDAGRCALAGGYRLGFVGDLTRCGGPEALYTSSLFMLQSELIERLASAVELGRSFVVEEYQRSFAPLMLLWRGIGAVLASRPELHTLIGALSVSKRYTLRSRQQIAGFLLSEERRSTLAPLARAKTPFDPAYDSPHALRDLEAEIVARDGRKMPVLVRQYLQIGMRGLSCGIDPAFSGCLDILCAADLRQTPAALLRRYMGEARAQAFLEHYGCRQEVA